MSKWPCQNGGMNRKENLLQTQRVGAPRNRHSLEKDLKVINSNDEAGEAFADLPAMPCKSRFKSRCGSVQRSGFACNLTLIPMDQAMRIKSAELWLRLGEPLEALGDIESLPQSLRRHSWVHKLHSSAMRAARDFEASSGSEH
jgi:hypothetical protein